MPSPEGRRTNSTAQSAKEDKVSKGIEITRKEDRFKM